MPNQELMSLVRSITPRSASPARRRPAKRAADAEENPEPIAGDGAGNGAPREPLAEVEGGASGRFEEADEAFLPRIPFIHVS